MTDTDNQLSALIDELRQFTHERDRASFHTPKNLAMAVAGEAGELVAEFQWLTAEQSEALDPAARAAVTSEMADVLIYLCLLADRLGIDLVEAGLQKVAQNRTRFPAPPDDTSPTVTGH